MSGRACLFTALVTMVSCRPVFQCADDSSCNLQEGGACEDNGYCSYPDGVCPSGQRFHEHAPVGVADECVDESPTSTGPTSSEATTVAPTTGDPPPACSTWENVYADVPGGDRPGKVTDLLMRPDGSYLLASTGDGHDGVADDTGRLLIRHIAAETGLDIEPPIEVGQTDAQNYQNYIRMPRITADGDLLAVFSWWMVDQKRAPALIHLGLDDHEVERDEIYVDADARALRRAAAIDDSTLVLAGNRWDELWYVKVKADGAPDHTWTLDPAWPAFNPLTASQDDQATVQGLVLLDEDAALLAGTLRIDEPESYTPWLRRINLKDGKTECECMGAPGGIMALANGEAGEVFFGGFRVVGVASQLWFGRIDSDCSLDCSPEKPAWNEFVDKVDNSISGAPETSKDAIHAVLALPEGRVLFAGLRDGKPFLLGYTAGGKPIFERELKDDKVTNVGVVYAIAPVLEASDCVVVAGVADALMWVRKLDLSADFSQL